MGKSGLLFALSLAAIALGAVLQGDGQASAAAMRPAPARLEVAATSEPAAPAGPTTFQYEALRARRGGSR